MDSTRKEIEDNEILEYTDILDNARVLIMDKINNMSTNYPFISLNIKQCLDKLKDDEEFICKIYGYSNTDKETRKICKDMYEVLLGTFYDTITDMIDKNVGDLMVKRSISQGEAMILVESAIEKQVGFMTMFFQAFVLSLLVCKKLVGE
jgi:hypothetical protein